MPLVQISKSIIDVPDVRIKPVLVPLQGFIATQLYVEQGEVGIRVSNHTHLDLNTLPLEIIIWANHSDKREKHKDIIVAAIRNFTLNMLDWSIRAGAPKVAVWLFMGMAAYKEG